MFLFGMFFVFSTPLSALLFIERVDIHFETANQMNNFTKMANEKI